MQPQHHRYRYYISVLSCTRTMSKMFCNSFPTNFNGFGTFNCHTNHFRRRIKICTTTSRVHGDSARDLWVAWPHFCPYSELDGRSSWADGGQMLVVIYQRSYHDIRYCQPCFWGPRLSYSPSDPQYLFKNWAFLLAPIAGGRVFSGKDQNELWILRSILTEASRHKTKWLLTMWEALRFQSKVTNCLVIL